MVDQGIAALRLTRVQGLLQSSSKKSVLIELLTRQPTIRRAKTSVTKATYTKPCKIDVGESADPQLVRPLRPELKVDAVERAWCLRIGNRRAHDLAAHHAVKPGLTHQALPGGSDRALHAGKSAARAQVPSAPVDDSTAIRLSALHRLSCQSPYVCQGPKVLSPSRGMHVSRKMPRNSI